MGVRKDDEVALSFPDDNPGHPPAYFEANNQAGYPQGGFPAEGSNPPPGIQPYGQQAGFHAQPAQTTIVVQQGAARPSSYHDLSCLVFWFCNCLFGGIAIGLSMASKSAADENDLENARKYGRAAMWVSISGIICSVVFGVIIIILFFTGSLFALNSYSYDYGY